MATFLTAWLAQVSFQGSSAPDWSTLENAWMVGVAYVGLVAAGLVVDVVLLIRLLGWPVGWRERVRRLEARAWAWRDAVRLVLLLVAFHLLGMLAYRAACPDLSPAGGDAAFGIILQSMVFHWAALVLITLVLRRERRSWKETFGLGGRHALRRIALGLGFYLGALPFLWFYSILYQAGLKYVGYEPRLQEVVWAMTAEHAWWIRAYLVGLAVALAPLAEELIFRGIGLPLLARKAGFPAAIVIVSVLFAAMHFHLPSLVPLFVIALAFSLAYAYTGSILVPAVMHAAFNLVNLGLLLLLRYA
ncbi:MAG: CPBP family intramembrane metalloprotease [Kiritimatiellae bacterium]|nr:CPBP family intramembrane metalloprotease [Kiritimatiellia bacterium]